MDDSKTLDLSTLDPEFTENPYPTYDRMREEAPVRRVIRHGLPAWLVTRSEDVMSVLTDPVFSINTDNAGPSVTRVPWLFGGRELGMQRHLGAVDPPDHTRLRRLISKVFTPGRIETLRPLIQQTADRLIDAFLPAERAELLAEYAYPLPVAVISEVLGVPEEDRAAFMAWNTTLVSGEATDPANIVAALTNIATYLSKLIDSKNDRSKAARYDLLTELVVARDEDDRLDDDELRSIAFQLLTAGFETTSVMIGNGMLALFKHPDQLARLYREPELTKNAVEEFLRYDAPVDTGIARFATAETTLGGVTIAAGDAVLFSLASANRDLGNAVDPHAFDITRKDTRHMAFAHGIHYCLGAPLARIEGQIAIRTLLDRCADLTLTVDVAEVTRKPSPFTRGVNRLPVTFRAEPEAGV